MMLQLCCKTTLSHVSTACQAQLFYLQAVRLDMLRKVGFLQHLRETKSTSCNMSSLTLCEPEPETASCDSRENKGLRHTMFGLYRANTAWMAVHFHTASVKARPFSSSGLACLQGFAGVVSYVGSVWPMSCLDNDKNNTFCHVLMYQQRYSRAFITCTCACCHNDFLPESSQQAQRHCFDKNHPCCTPYHNSSYVPRYCVLQYL